MEQISREDLIALIKFAERACDECTIGECEKCLVQKYRKIYLE